MYTQTTQGIQVEVTPEYLPNESQPEAAQFVFAYHIRITNLGQTEVQLLSRHWKITDGDGATHEVKGAGVVGERPILRPQQSFEYSSFCPISTPTGSMEGTYQMENDLGARFDIKIPRFFLQADLLLN